MPQLLKVAVDDEDEDARAAGVELLEFFQTGRGMFDQFRYLTN